MAFRYIDKITEVHEGVSAKGIKLVTRNEPFYYWLPDGTRALSPAVITEAVSQLGAQLQIKSTGFTKNSVLLADEKTSYYGFAYVGDRIDLSVNISIEDDVVIGSSRASVNGKVIQETFCSRAYLLPLEDFDTVEAAKNRYKNLLREDGDDPIYENGNPQAFSPQIKNTGLDALRYVDGIIEHVPYKKVVGFKNFTACEPYFESHFPLKPVAPGVLLMSFVGELTQLIIKDDIFSPIRGRGLIPIYSQNTRFRKFVEPGDRCILTVELKDGDPRVDCSDILVSASIRANNKRVMQTEMGFRTSYGVHSRALEGLRR